MGSPPVAIHFQATLVIPLDDAVNGLAIAQDEDHRGLGLHLLDVVEILRVGLVGWNWFFLQWRPPGRRDLLFNFV